MTTNKSERWYEVDGEEVRVYNNPHPDKATSVSVVTKADLPYYRANFVLSKVWASEAPKQD